ncbi:NAD(P)H-binding protein [Gemmatimonas groenlandica]|uniref:NAD(P)H-binding protein n=1 Tax=Gemmatimonas groenlandica TaxID=2732249 RepID=A0A6M4ITR7_9BACT|nr:NAD(P)H-binding protein [Gemmatimonas groenlandica]QJR37518.1 NAD(P)H-binding protein [Gemmatimonas groenlandica]
MSTILVLGAAGNVGSELSRLLAAAGHNVRRATSRTAGDGQVHLDLTTGAGLDAALTGADAAFLLAPPGYTNQDALLGPVIDGAKKHGLKKVVLMTAMGADGDPNGAMRKAELMLEQSGLAWNVIRPNWFMQNFHTFWMGGIQQANAILLPVAQAKGSFIDARDIAAVASVLLQGRGFDNQAFDLTGSEALDHDEVAAILSRETNRSIRYEEVTTDAMRAGLLGAGVPADYAEFLLVILEYFRLGYSERTTDSVRTITGQAPRGFAQYARDYKAEFALPKALS